MWVAPFAATTVVARSDVHGSSARPGRQSQTVPHRSRGALDTVAFVDRLPFDPPKPAGATPRRTLTARNASLKTRVEIDMGRVPDTSAATRGRNDPRQLDNMAGNRARQDARPVGPN